MCLPVMCSQVESGTLDVELTILNDIFDASQKEIILKFLRWQMGRFVKAPSP